MTALLEKDFSPSEFALFSEILWKLGSGKGQYNLRENILADIAILLRADFAASYIWDSTSNLSREGVIWKIDPKAMEDYESIWQFDDPITAQLRKRQKPTFVNEVMPLANLKKTPYYNEFLSAYRLYHGINIYFVRNGMDIGDLRIWRAKDTDMFGEREKRILSLLEPYFTQALPTDLSSQYGLTSREQEVVRLVSKGLSDKHVANLLEISFTTLRTHLNNSMRKIGCNNRTEMALLIRH
ncbi:helix-turn-helix transcriptional regulator [Acinetobacter nosocomialis]|uniref:response regulator transcription factor n=1 Tax=Acinetobacter nosocomialis TaxID=106654 RepID=UPI000B3DA552|nr:helix-turn-helix transcriptional regulator [Acinetobacter nosocomialis]MBD0443613.1 helix-turn-helix transcriptional regulator [Acinetobacter nosocomialis]MDQ9038891.1 helix-turn-helix transcriptional regulator [Acinetobacter nosocomialis]MDR9533956.1 helix-turn-helix transcriptional regulator [Acinetobacter nosocomialis]OUT27288.1 DNA-binding HTH domain-containing protein [Acinetobacter nosocomialis P020]PSE13815.1 LuxR family transcriptional regulator [Acinetobacter nosocomialis]